MELEELNGIGVKRLEIFKNFGINTTTDLLNYLPYKYYNFTKIDVFDKSSNTLLLVCAKVVKEPKCVFFKGLNYCIVVFEDTTTNEQFNAVWYNQPFMKNNIELSGLYYLFGKLNSKHQLVVQSYFPLSKTSEKIMPCYKALESISSLTIKKSIKQILDSIEENSSTPDNSIGLMNKNTALKEVHFPSSLEKIEEAKFRLNIDELLNFVALEKFLEERKDKKDFAYSTISIKDFEQLLPFNLTIDQKNAIEDIFSDMDNQICMNRLILGDVGSGKTMVAFASMFKCALSGHQCVMLCPTDVLASQHYSNAVKLFHNFGVCYLHSGIKKSERVQILKGIELGEYKIIIATHSILSEVIKFNNLSLLITDEQHRFGVIARGTLSSRHKIDQLVMSATPIPRSLSLVLFGGLKTSEINSRPNGASNIKTNILSSKKVLDMWHFIQEELKKSNRKCFVVVPKIVDSENDNISSTTSIIKYLIANKIFNKEEISEVNGSIKKEIAHKTLEEFRDNPTKKVLVATTIIEVGIDIPSANIMVIMNADRFGLATLHQLRGRVGRDGSAGFCFLVSDNTNEISKERLKVLKENNNGLKIAEEDLKLRGAGSVLGTSQHGVEELFSDVSFSVESFDKAKELWKTLSLEQKESITQKALASYGDLYKKIVFN